MFESIVADSFNPPFLKSQPLRLLSRREYDQLVDHGWFVDEPIELLRGVLVTMSPQGRAHASAIQFLNEQLVLQLAGRHGVRPQLPLAADDWSEPEPDLAVVRKDPSLRDHPSEALLVVEIASSSLTIDRGLKRTIYAEVGIPEYWVVDVNGRTVEVHTRPDGGYYSRVHILRDGDVLRPTLLPEVAIWVADIPR